MTDELEIPSEHQFAFNRLMRRMPADIRGNEKFRRTMLLYLKVGGEKLALASINALVTPFTEEFILKKIQAPEEDTVQSADAGKGTESSGQAGKEDDGKKDEASAGST